MKPNIENSPEQVIPRPMVALRIYELMAENNIRSVAALHRILVAKKFTISHSQLLRIVDNRADHLKMEVIGIFVNIFDCEVGKLFKIVH
jgi:hypothetical protein